MLMIRRLHYYCLHSTLILLPQLLLLLSSLFFLTSSSLTNLNHNLHVHTYIYAGCSPNRYQPNSPFETNLNSILSSIMAASSQSSYNSFAVGNNTSTPPDGAAYGLYQCRGDLKITDCSSCIQSAINQIGLVCPDAYGARLQLEGCLVRYENINFLGKLDATVAFKKCSQSTSNDVEFFRRRDDVLADLQAATSFRVSSSGLVEGFAQCLGDLSQGDCTSCLADAVGKLKYVCGSAAAVDVYLAECYARYWAAGYYESGGSSEDQIGKTVAIIVGVLAGLAILVVLLSFLRKTAG